MHCTNCRRSHTLPRKGKLELFLPTTACPLCNFQVCIRRRVLCQIDNFPVYHQNSSAQGEYFKLCALVLYRYLQ